MPPWTPDSRLATRLTFLVAGFGVAAWAPLVPFAKTRLGIDDAVLGALLLCIGVGSVAAMQAAGLATARIGSRPVILAGGLGMALVLPLLALAPTPATLGAALLGFGAALGAIDVAMNVHAVEVERREGRPLLSGFHALFSLGGFAGAGLMTLVLSTQGGALAGTALSAGLMAVLLAWAWPGLVATPRTADGPLLVVPRGVVWLLALLAAVTFLTEGAVLDWSALLLADSGLVAPARGGLGFAVFSVAMTLGRFGGDRVVARLGDRATLLWSGVTTIAGYVLFLTAPVAALAMLGLLVTGLGAANIVPVLFRRAGAQDDMPPGLGIAAVTLVGYAGILAGPAGIGFVAQLTGLRVALWGVAGLVLLVPLLARRVTA